jgi:hypothetical protein
MSKRLLQSARLKSVPFQIRSCMGRLFPPFEKREGWGTLGCGASVEIKGVGQECPTHTSVSDPHKNVRFPATLDFYLSSTDDPEVLGFPK